jgi:uncharacterized protein
VSTAFADSSAVVKLYADEADADVVRSMSGLVVSQLVRVEMPAALWRKHRIGDLSASDTGVLVSAFEADYYGTDQQPPRFFVVGLSANVLDHAARLVAVHGLRAYDATQLASARAVRDAVPDGVAFLAFDKSVRAAAAAEGLALLPE